MLIIPLNLDSVLLLLHNSKLAYWTIETIDYSRAPCLGADQKARGLWDPEPPFPRARSPPIAIDQALEARSGCSGSLHADYNTANILSLAAFRSPTFVGARLLLFVTSTVRFSTATIRMTSTKKHFKRLPANVVPKNYKLTLKPNLTEFIFTGEEAIDVEVR